MGTHIGFAAHILQAEIEIEIVYNMYRMRRFYTKSRMRRLLSLGPPNYALTTSKENHDVAHSASETSLRRVFWLVRLNVRTCTYREVLVVHCASEPLLILE